MFMGMLLGEWHIDALLGRKIAPNNEECDDRARHCVAVFLQGVNARG